MLKTKEIIERLRNPQEVVSIVTCKQAANRLEELSTGYHSLPAEVATKIYTFHELARMYVIRCEYAQELHDENIKLKEEIERLKGNGKREVL